MVRISSGDQFSGSQKIATPTYTLEVPTCLSNTAKHVRNHIVVPQYISESVCPLPNLTNCHASSPTNKMTHTACFVLVDCAWQQGSSCVTKYSPSTFVNSLNYLLINRNKTVSNPDFSHFQNGIRCTLTCF